MGTRQHARGWLAAALVTLACAAGCSGSVTPAPGDGGTAGDAGAPPPPGDAASCPAVATYCAASPQPVECQGEAAKIAQLCGGAAAVVRKAGTTCPGIVAVYQQGVDTATIFYFDSNGQLVGVVHTGIGGESCSAAGGAFTVSCTATGTPQPACGDAG
jgi:hypothetical protein